MRGVLAVPAVALTTGAAGAATINVPANIPNPGSNGFDTGIAGRGSVSVSGSGTWCTNNVPADCNGPNGLASRTMAPNFLYQVAGTAFAPVGRVGTSGPWTLGGDRTDVDHRDRRALPRDERRSRPVRRQQRHDAGHRHRVDGAGTIVPVSSTVTVGKDGAVW